ncbi:signal transduction histidine kinase/CheY-like chemotaxis protein [Rhizobium sp. SG_E_25_P2]|uniref:ATP-binding protein n=1 Tax=Rhizobium sp. SG_E_25_P2 TaxID=2879942 RepID=UPI0024733DA4|nr:ATP-binding protein [Rhizobium sp. SG_E_25_P2]MDH6264984.1 signal transduction histidine kinase/CheY-like chemotaxis protein [Rhizobium sp. SG_E_25_P2]
MDLRYPVRDPSRRDFSPPLEPDPDELLASTDMEGPGSMKYWIAGSALVAAALALSSGLEVGLLAMGGFLAAVAIGSLFLRSSARNSPQQRTQSPATAAQTTQVADELSTSQGDSRLAAGVLMGAIHDALGDITVCRSLKGVILSANNTFRRVSGCETPEGRTCESLGIRFEPGKIKHCYDVSFRTRDGLRTYLWHDIVTRDPVMGDMVVQSIARDVTSERFDAESREQARARAEEESQLKSQLIATVSHEIRTPLSGLLGMGQLLSDTELTPAQANYLAGIRSSGVALAQLVEDLLDFSTVEAGRFRLRPRAEPIRPLVESIVELLSSRAHEKGVEIGAVMAPDLPEILTIDPARLKQVIYNVVGNAVKFTEQGGVVVSVGVEAGHLVVTVRDTGPGMNEGEMKRIFDAFEQGDLSRAREGGVGLGLAISARIMAEMGGGVTVESELGQGSVFTIRMPADMETRPMRSGRELAGGRILLLAPVGPAARALAETLQGLGAETHAASAIIDAETLLTMREKFTGIIVDHRLDAEFTAGLCRDPRLAGAKRVYLVNPESRPAQMSGGAYDGWLIRPLREQSLIDVLTGRLKGLEARDAANDDFPVLAAEAQEDEQAAARPGAGSGFSILIGEDDPVNAMICQAILEKAGHRARLADTFNKLDAAFLEKKPDLILTDHHMSDGVCLDFIARLRDTEAAEGLPVTPVIVLTADASDATRRELLLRGADLVLLKPADPDILNGAILRLLGKPALEIAV